MVTARPHGMMGYRLLMGQAFSSIRLKEHVPAVSESLKLNILNESVIENPAACLPLANSVIWQKNASRECKPAG
jgi:hypothetical protein